MDRERWDLLREVLDEHQDGFGRSLNVHQQEALTTLMAEFQNLQANLESKSEVIALNDHDSALLSRYHNRLLDQMPKCHPNSNEHKMYIGATVTSKMVNLAYKLGYRRALMVHISKRRTR